MEGGIAGLVILLVAAVVGFRAYKRKQEAEFEAMMSEDLEEVSEAEEEGPEEVEEPEPVDYNSMTVAHLKEILQERDLTIGGNKAELVARLEEDDIQLAKFKAKFTRCKTGTSCRGQDDDDDEDILGDLEIEDDDDDDEDILGDLEIEDDDDDDDDEDILGDLEIEDDDDGIELDEVGGDPEIEDSEEEIQEPLDAPEEISEDDFEEDSKQRFRGR